RFGPEQIPLCSDLLPPLYDRLQHGGACLVSPEAIGRAIQLILAPVVMFSACSVFVGGVLNHYTSVGDRIRALTRERLDLLRVDNAGRRGAHHHGDRLLAPLTHVRSGPGDTAAGCRNGNLGRRDCPRMSRTTTNGAARELLSQPAAEHQRLIDQRERATPWWR